MSLVQALILTWIFGNVSERILHSDDCMVPCVLRVLFSTCDNDTNARVVQASWGQKGDTVLTTALKGMVAKLLAGEAGPGLRSLGSNCWWWWCISHTAVSGVITLIILWFYPVFTHIIELFSKGKQCCESKLMRCVCFVIQWRFSASFQRFKKLYVQKQYFQGIL